nr:hypothetical protein GCM10023233_02950 [Brevibacterium otitidis]BFF05329.1 hypothetical protein GCM10023233_02980 [Brevibacterium otitidis]
MPLRNPIDPSSQTGVGGVSLRCGSAAWLDHFYIVSLEPDSDEPAPRVIEPDEHCSIHRVPAGGQPANVLGSVFLPDDTSDHRQRGPVWPIAGRRRIENVLIRRRRRW